MTAVVLTLPCSPRARQALAFLRQHLGKELARRAVLDLERATCLLERLEAMMRLLSLGDFVDAHRPDAWLEALGYGEQNCTRCGKRLLRGKCCAVDRERGMQWCEPCAYVVSAGG